MNQLWVEFRKTLAFEIGADLADLFVDSLFRSSGGDVTHAANLYYQIGIEWASVVIGWRDWVMQNAQYESPVLIMRDAKPLSVVSISDRWPKVWLNRQNCGVFDEISGDASGKHPLLDEYLEQHGLHQPFTFVDSGCWGTIVRGLYLQLGMEFQPLFFFSHNPAIPGFLNDLGVDEKNGEILNDSLECCFPNLTARPANLIRGKGGYINPEFVRLDPLSFMLGNAVLDGVSDGTVRKNTVNPIDAVEHLLSLSETARITGFTGILPQSSPTWSQGDQFLRDWPEKLSWT